MTHRNPYVLPAILRKAGAFRSKKTSVNRDKVEEICTCGNDEFQYDASKKELWCSSCLRTIRKFGSYEQ